MYCKKCGNPLNETDKFCRKCGAVVTPLIDDAAAPVEYIEPKPVAVAPQEPTVAPGQSTPAPAFGASSVDRDAKAALDYLDMMFADLGFTSEPNPSVYGEGASAPQAVEKIATERILAEQPAPEPPPKATTESPAKSPTEEVEDVEKVTGEIDQAQNSNKAAATPTAKKASPLKIILTILIIAAVTALATGIFLFEWPKLFRSEDQDKTPTQSGGLPLSSPANPLDSIGEESSIMDASIKAYSENGPNINNIETLYDLKFTEDREYNLDGLNKAILFDDDLWYMNDIMENIHYTPEIVRTLIEYFSTLMDRKNTGSDDVLLYIREDSDLYQETEAIKADEGKTHTIEKMQIGEMRRSGEDFYVLIGITETIEGASSPASTEEYVKAVHLFARPKTLEIREAHDPIETAPKGDEVKDDESKEDESTDNESDGN